MITGQVLYSSRSPYGPRVSFSFSRVLSPLDFYICITGGDGRRDGNESKETAALDSYQRCFILPRYSSQGLLSIMCIHETVLGIHLRLHTSVGSLMIATPILDWGTSKCNKAAVHPNPVREYYVCVSWCWAIAKEITTREILTGEFIQGRLSATNVDYSRVIIARTES